VEDMVILEWTFTPENYFEEDFDLGDEQYILHITKGKVEAHIDPVHYDIEHKTRYDLHQKVEAVFLARNLFIHQTYTLSTSTVYRLYSDGRRDAYAFMEGLQAHATSSATLDIIIIDQDGNVTCDTRRDRIEETNTFVRLVAKHDNDILLKTLLKSYNLAVKYPENEFIYLYEIREILDNISKNTKTTDFFHISEYDWKRFNDLVNNEPLTQGRHRGKKAPDLRNATREELNEARSISKKFIEAYLNYLEIYEI
jgi:hypothetical protein